jgi:hypothetical protein
MKTTIKISPTNPTKNHESFGFFAKHVTPAYFDNVNGMIELVNWEHYKSMLINLVTDLVLIGNISVNNKELHKTLAESTPKMTMAKLDSLLTMLVATREINAEIFAEEQLSMFQTIELDRRNAAIRLG